MNRAVAKVYAISTRHESRPHTPEEKDRLIECIPELISEVERMETLLRDPFIAGYIARFCTSPNTKRWLIWTA